MVMNKEYNEGWKAYRVAYNESDKNKCPYSLLTQEYRDWNRGFDASEAAYAHNGGGDW